MIDEKKADELFILEGEDFDIIRQKAIEIIQILPSEPKTAVMILSLTLNLIEKDTGIKIKRVGIKERGKNDTYKFL